jgi:hypothetical protein
LEPLDYREFHRMSQLLFRDLFIELDREIENLELIPKHGPGVVNIPALVLTSME